MASVQASRIKGKSPVHVDHLQRVLLRKPENFVCPLPTPLALGAVDDTK